MSNDDDPDDLRYLKRTRDKEKTKEQIKKGNDTERKKNEEQYENKNEDAKTEAEKIKDGKNGYKDEDKNMDTGGIREDANGITRIVMRPRLNKRAITIKAILKDNSMREIAPYLQHSLGGEKLLSIQTGELIVAGNGTLENRNIRRFFSAFSETTSSPWKRTCQDLFSRIFQSPMNRESILIIENVAVRGYTVSLVKIILLNHTAAQICFSTLQEKFTAVDESLNLMQAVGDSFHGFYGRSFRNLENCGSFLIISDATKVRRLILATTPLSYLNDSRILFLVSQEAFTPKGVNLNGIQAAEDNCSRAVIVRTQLGALVPVEVVRSRCQPYSVPHHSDGKQSQGVLRTLRSRARPRDLSGFNQRSPVSVLDLLVNVQVNMPASRTRAKERSRAIPGRSDSACGSPPFPQCKMKATGPSPESSTSKRNTTHLAKLPLERKDLVNMNAPLKPPRQMVHGNTLTTRKGGKITVHSKRRPSIDTLLKYSTQCTDTEGYAVTCDSKGRYEPSCQDESEDVCTQGESCKEPVMESGGKLYNTCENVRNKKIVDGTNTSGNNGGACGKSTGIKGETETKLKTPVQCEEDICSVQHNNARANGDTDLGNQGGVRRRPVPKGTLRMHGTVLYAQCDEDDLFEYTWKLDEEHRRVRMRLLCPRCSALPRCVVLIPCRHLMCSSCYQGQQSCPICHQRVYTSSHALLS